MREISVLQRRIRITAAVLSAGAVISACGDKQAARPPVEVAPKTEREIAAQAPSTIETSSLRLESLRLYLAWSDLMTVLLGDVEPSWPEGRRVWLELNDRCRLRKSGALPQHAGLDLETSVALASRTGGEEGCPASFEMTVQPTEAGPVQFSPVKNETEEFPPGSTRVLVHCTRLDFAFKAAPGLKESTGSDLEGLNLKGHGCLRRNRPLGEWTLMQTTEEYAGELISKRLGRLPAELRINKVARRNGESSELSAERTRRITFPSGIQEWKVTRTYRDQKQVSVAYHYNGQELTQAEFLEALEKAAQTP